jgi:HAD superfamily hydrolase (TIGR01490 family)
MKRGIALFDFDGTITTKDTLLEFIRFTKGSCALYMGFAIHILYLVGYKLKFISNQQAKEKVLEHFFKGMEMQQFERLCQAFYEKKLGKLIRPKALEEIERLKRAQFVVVIVSASPENWIRGWAKDMGVELIGSQLEVKEGRLTGKIVGKNCHGAEKVRRIKEKYRIEDYDLVYAYGDTKGDLPMLELGTQTFYRPFA